MAWRYHPQRGVLLSEMWEMVRRVPAPLVAHPFDVKQGSGLACRIYQGRGELDTHKACLTGDESHRSYVQEESPPPINISVVVVQGVRALLG